MIEKVLVLTTVWLFAQFHGAQGDGTCRVSGNNMTCRGENALHNLDKRKKYTDVDTLYVHQASLDLTDDMVPDGVSLSHISLLNATDNEISRIGRRGFDKMRNIEFLDLSQNQISHAQPDPFQALERLKYLQLNDALDGNIEEKSDLLRNFFKSKNKFTELATIELNNNKIEAIHPKTFCGVSGLKRLELSNNRIQNFEFARSCFSELKALMLAGNLIEKIPTNIWDFLPFLSTLDISNNPINCDCDTIRLLKNDDINYINQAETKCASPPELENKRIFDIPNDYCSPSRNPRGKSSFFQFLVLFVIAIGILWAYKRYRERLNHMSAAPVGYTNLHHEQAVEPEFV